MANGIFKLKDQLQGLIQKSWNVTVQTAVPPFSTYVASFNNTNQYLTTNSVTLSGNFTIEGWLFYIDSDINNVFFSIGNYSSGGLELWCNNQYYTMDGYGNGGYFFNNDGAPVPVRTWFHFAVVRSGSTVTAYINGIAGKSYTNANSFTGAMRIGAADNGSILNFWDGSISNIRVTNTAVYTSNFTVPSSPLTNISGTQLLTLQNATIIDNSSNGYTITNSGSVATVAASLNNPITYLPSSNPPPRVDYLVVAGGGSGGLGGGGAGGLLLGSYPITAGASNTITIGAGGSSSSGSDSAFGSITAKGGGASGGNPAPGGSGGSGGGAYLASNLPGQGTFGQGNSGAIGSASGGSGGGGGGAGTLGNAGSNINTGGNGGGGAASAISGTLTAYAGGGGGYGSSTGGFGGAGGGGNGPTAGGAGTTGTANTGGGGGGDTGGSPKSGGSGVVIASYPDIYNPPTSLTGINPVTITSGSGSLLCNGSVVGTNGFRYSGETQFVFGTGDFTIEFWTSVSNFSTYPTFTDFRNVGSSGNGPNIYCMTNGELRYYSNGSDRISSGATVLALNVWYHIALCRIGTATKLYLNGTQVGSTYTDTTNYACATTGPHFLINCDENSGRVDGNTTNIRIVKGVGVYTGTFTPSTIPLQVTQSAGTNIAAITGTQTSLLLSNVSGSFLADSSTYSLAPKVATTNPNPPVWNPASPFATGLGYKNRVYIWRNGSGTVTF